MRMHSLLLRTLICAALGGCVTPAPIKSSTGENDAKLGAVALHSARLGQASLNPTRCQAGDRAFFLGGDFIDDASGVVLRLAFDPLDGAAVRLFVPGASPERSIVFRRVDCRVLDATLDPTNWKINDVSDYRLTLKFDCARGDDAASGQVAAVHCH